MYGINFLSAESNAKTFKQILLKARMITFHIYVQCSFDEVQQQIQSIQCNKI